MLDAPIFFSAAAEVVSPNWTSKFAPMHRQAISARVRTAVASALEDIPPPTWSEYFVNIRRVGANMLDDDNLAGACKPARDQIAQWLGYDDSARSPIRWQCTQRTAREPDADPKRKGKYRTWLEVTVSPVPTTEGGNSAPPSRLERERTKAPIRVDKDYSRPIRDIELVPRPNGTRVRVSLMADAHGQRVRVCTAYMQQGHHWRTTGVSLDMGEVSALIDALVAIGEGAAVSGAGGGSVVPRGVISSVAEGGRGSDAPSDNMKNNTDVGKGAQLQPIPSGREYSNSLPRPVPQEKPRKTKHLNPKPPPLPKPRRPPPHDPPPGHRWDGQGWQPDPQPIDDPDTEDS